uniref:Glycerol-3-phosphate dehydrogenase [NAD(+)] n=1 Tax=Meloidogyne incognita TaxID=6306 RepID=A0A914MP90_MELIC
MAQKKVTIVGSGNWGSAIARIIGNTVVQHNTTFQTRVPMWVFEEMVDDRKLSEIINTEHINVKYLPGKKLPENIVAVPDLLEATKDADILVFVVPHQFVEKLCNQLKGNVKSSAVAVSLIKGLSGKSTSSKLRLISEDISETLGIDAAVLMGANLAPEVANDNFCEATIGSKNLATAIELKKLFHTDNFRINIVQDFQTVEICGALKNVVACAAGFSDGLGYGDNTKAAIIRLGLMEMMRFIEYFYPNTRIKTFFESCGIADLVTTCYGGRNRKVCEAFAKTKRPLYELEAELLKGQSAQGPLTAAELYDVIKTRDLLKMFPLFEAVHNICIGQVPVEEFIGKIRNHPEYEDRSNAEFH